jgi:hypothetical protein
MAQARSEEYATIIREANAARSLAVVERARQLKRLRRELREVQRRDYFPPAERNVARIVVDDLARAARSADAACDEVSR